MHELVMDATEEGEVLRTVVPSLTPVADVMNVQHAAHGALGKGATGTVCPDGVRGSARIEFAEKKNSLFA